MNKISLCALVILVLGFSSCGNARVMSDSSAFTGNTSGITEMASTADENGLNGEIHTDTNGGSSSASSGITHPVFDIEGFDTHNFNDTSQLFNFHVQSAVSAVEDRNIIRYRLVITPKSDEKIGNIVVTASLDPKLSEILMDKNRTTLYFGTSKNQPFTMKKRSESEKGLISDIGKDLQDDILPENAKEYLKLPVKVVVKYNDKISSFTITPSIILYFGKELHAERSNIY